MGVEGCCLPHSHYVAHVGYVGCVMPIVFIMLIVLVVTNILSHVHTLTPYGAIQLVWGLSLAPQWALIFYIFF